MLLLLHLQHFFSSSSTFGELAQQCCSLSFVAVKFVAAFFVLQHVAGFRVFVYSVHGLWLSTVGKSSAQSDPMKLLVGVLL